MKNMRKEDAVAIDTYLGSQLDEVVGELISLRNHGDNVYTIFNGHKLYSVDVTIDSAYLQVTGYDQKTFNNLRKLDNQRFQQRQEEAKQKALNNIPYWIGQGKRFIPKNLWDEWEQCVEIRANDLYNGMELDCALDIFAKIENETAKTKQDVEALLTKQNHSGASYSITKSMLTHFSDKYNKLKDTAETTADKNTERNLEL